MPPPKSRQKYNRRDPGDMPWNPKAKVVMPVPKMNRPHREGVRKAHVEEGLADAKARLANKVLYHFDLLQNLLCSVIVSISREFYLGIKSQKSLCITGWMFLLLNFHMSGSPVNI